MKSDRDLVWCLQSGDEIAWSEFYNSHVQALYNFIRTNGVYDPVSIHNLLLEIWAAAPKAIASFNGQSTTLKTFLFSIACRKISDFWRKQTFRDALPKAIPDVEYTEASVALREALAKLSVQERQVLILRYLEGFSVEEIAAILDRTRKGIEALLSRSAHQLGNAL